MILVPRPGIEPMPLALKAQSLNHWVAREVTHVLYVLDRMSREDLCGSSQNEPSR